MGWKQPFNKLPTNLLANKYMYVKKSSTGIYVRTPFDSANDLVQYLNPNVAGASTHANPLFSPYYTYLLNKTTAYTYAQTWLGTNYHGSLSDDLCPLNYNGSYMGGGHGAYAVRNLTVASHDKTTADLGSVWTDAGAKTWYLVRVVDATHLWVISDFGTDGTNGYWTFNATIGASPLTHVSGATNTANIVFTSSAVASFLPSVKNVTLKVLIDGMIDAVDSTVTQCAFLDVIQEYDICDPRTTLAYMKANIGKTIIEAVADASATADVHMFIRYRYFPNGSCVVYHTITTVNYLHLLEFGGVQSFPLEYTGKKLYQYIPRATTLVGSVKTWDFTTLEEIDGTFENITLDSTHWKVSTAPPFRSTQILKDSSDVPIIGFSLGYSLSKSDTIDTTRKNNVTAKAVNISGSTRKQYPNAYNAYEAAGANTYKALCYRGYFDPNNINGATVYQYHQEGNELIVDIDYHTNASGVHLPIPAGWNGKTVTTLHSDGGITVHTTVVDGNGLIVSVAGGYGSATVKIS